MHLEGLWLKRSIVHAFEIDMLLTVALSFGDACFSKPKENTKSKSCSVTFGVVICIVYLFSLIFFPLSNNSGRCVGILSRLF